MSVEDAALLSYGPKQRVCVHFLDASNGCNGMQKEICWKLMQHQKAWPRKAAGKNMYGRLAGETVHCFHFGE